MNRKSKMVVLGGVLLVSFISCTNSNKPVAPATPPATSQTPTVRPSKSNADLVKMLRDRMNQRIIDTTIPKTSMSLDEKTFDFGTVPGGNVVTHNFKFTNTGSNPLLVYNVQGTCGCTIPNWPKTPIKPGESNNITIQYNSQGESGLQNKKVRIFTNTKPIETDIIFKANVKN